MNENLQFYRKQLGLTQEKFAEKLGVSRQSVSKWESGTAYPETEKLLIMCDMFGCTLDTLMRGSASKTSHTTKSLYESTYNKFTLRICMGVFLILVGICQFTSLDMQEDLQVIIFFIFLIPAVLIFIASGLIYSRFVDKNPNLPDFYTEEEKDCANKRFIISLCFEIFLVLMAVLFILLLEAIGYPNPVIAFMPTIAIAVPCIIYSSMIFAKYIPNKSDANSNTKSKYCDIIMPCCVVIYLFIGFVYNLWHPGWIIFLVGVIIITIIDFFTKKE